MIRSLSIAILLISLSVDCFAGWSAYWPAYDYQRKGRTNAQDCINAWNERADVIKSGTNLYVSWTWYRRQREALSDIKSAINSSLQYFVATNTTLTNSTTLAVNYTVASLMQECGLPSNYLSYTPWRCLNGLGSLNNDVTVGRAHGWTNSFTAQSGGSPYGRATHYTTDYGWDGLKTIIPKLNEVIISNVATFNGYSINYDVYFDTREQTAYDGAGSELPNWDDVFVNWTNDYGATGIATNDGYWTLNGLTTNLNASSSTYGIYHASVMFSASVFGAPPNAKESGTSIRSSYRVRLLDMPTNVSSTIDIYGRFYDYTSIIPDRWFDMDGIAWGGSGGSGQTNYYYFLGTILSSSTTNRESGWIGSILDNPYDTYDMAGAIDTNSLPFGVSAGIYSPQPAMIIRFSGFDYN